MFAAQTRYNCLGQFRYAGYAGSIGYKSPRAAAHIECFAYIDRRQTDIENPKGIYIERTVANKNLQQSFALHISP
jgi:hypothetical protein